MTKFKATTALCLTAFLFLTACSSPEEKEERYIKQGNALYDKGEFEKARIEYKNAARIKPTAAEPAYRIGLVDEAEGDFRNAFGNFVAATQQDKHFAPAALKIAQYMIGSDQYGEARTRIEGVLGDNPSDAEAHALLSSLLLHEGKVEEAEKEAQAALGFDPANIAACAALTGVYVREKNFDKALASVNEGLGHHPDSIPLLMLRVMVYGNTNDLDKIGETFHAVFKLKPELAQFRIDLADIYTKNGKLDEAEATLREGIAARPDDLNLQHALIVFLDHQRGFEAAEKEIKSIITANPQNNQAYIWLANLYVEHNATDQALALLQQIVDQEPAGQPALGAETQLARLHFKRGDKETAIQLTDAVLTKAPDNPEALLIRANMAFENGNYQNAISDCRAILRTTPTAKGALQLLAESLLVQGHTDLAIDTMEKLLDSDPGDQTAQIRLAQMLQMNGDHQKAMELIQSVTKTSPAIGVAWESTARFAIEDKQWLVAEEAIKLLDKIDGQHWTATYLEAQILQANGKNEDAAQHYKSIIAANPASPLAEHALTSLAESYYKAGAAADFCGYLESIKQDSAFTNSLLGECYRKTGRKADSIKAFDKAIAAKATTQQPYLNRAELYIEDGNTDAALDVLKLAMAADARDYRAAMMTADTLVATGHYSDAATLYEDVMQRNPSYVPAANNLAEMIADYQYQDAAALEKARQIAERFSGSTDPLLLDTLAWVYYRQGNGQLAETVMERGMPKQNGAALPAQIHYHYGAILAKNGKTAEAIQELRLATAQNAPYPGSEDAKKLLANLQ